MITITHINTTDRCGSCQEYPPPPARFAILIEYPGDEHSLLAHLCRECASKAIHRFADVIHSDKKWGK